MTRYIDADEAIKKAECYGWDTTAINNAPTVDAIPVSYFAEELHLIREILARRKYLPMEYRRELEAEKKYLRDWINHWRYESDQGFYGVQWKALSEDEIIAKRKEE